MVFFIILIIDIMFILLPNLLYIIYVVNKKNLNKDINKIVLDLSLLTSTFLIIIFNNIYSNQISLIIILVIFLLSLKYKRIMVSILISLIFIEYSCCFINFDYRVIIPFISILSLNCILKNSKYYNAINLFLVLCLTVFIPTNMVSLIVNTIMLIISYIIVNILNNESSKILELQSILKDYEKEKNLKISIFKITHEIKNPLSVVKGYLSMININNPVKAESYLKIINGEVERTLNLLNDFMQFSKIEIHKERVNLNELFSEVKNILTPLTSDKKIKLVFKSNNITINIDYNRIKQVLINIIKNSIESSKFGSSINITSFVKKDLNIIVKDYGIGMNGETLNNLFIPFNTTKEKGTGLGVCLSKEIVEAHNGKITYSSCYGKGTTVKIVLPIN